MRTFDINSELVDFVTTWDSRCGIAVYSKSLVTELRRDARIRIVRVPDTHAFTPYFFVLGFKTGRSQGFVHVQFAYGIFPELKLGRYGFLAFTALLFYLGLAFGKSQVITTFHEVMETVSSRSRLRLSYLKLLNKMVCTVSDLIIVHTLESRELMVKNYGVSGPSIKVIPMGCYENPLFLDKDACKEELNLSGKKVITIPGFLNEHKGHDLLVDILPLLGEDVHLVVAGGTRTKDGAVFYEKVKGLAERNHCIGRMTFCDDFPIAPVVMNATDVAVLPYRYATESLALRLLIAYRVPTITSDLNVFKEIKREFECIELFGSGDKADLLARLSSLLSDQKRRNLLREQCKKMWTRTKWSSIATEHLETYLEVAAAHPEAIYDEKRQKERIDWLRQNVSGYSLEIGCATGFVTSYVGVAVGLDINKHRIRLAKRKHPDKEFVISDAECLPFKMGAFDTVLIPEILEHVTIEQAERIVSQARVVGSKILITLPNAGKEDYDKSLVENPEHKWFPTEERVMKSVKGCDIRYTSENDFMLVCAT